MLCHSNCLKLNQLEGKSVIDPCGSSCSIIHWNVVLDQPFDSAITYSSSTVLIAAPTALLISSIATLTTTVINIITLFIFSVLQCNFNFNFNPLMLCCVYSQPNELAEKSVIDHFFFFLKCQIIYCVLHQLNNILPLILHLLF